ncbi:hypothetical protein [Hyphomicrobium sp.]|uniref:hypothetical protein n=1 Tax=Hyphomicrobium sp. TaxID=82 RepID=UPI002E32A8BB|nr:hypothetical protein [Hyphomicrobium sp.]HEX2841827.1 hypothetical protein [Hyphomicrobium sp.]
MGHGDEPKLDELKRLLRRLDGLDTGKGVGQATAGAGDDDQRGYVGALRGMPAIQGDDPTSHLSVSDAKKSGNSAIYLAAAAAAAISTVTVYLLMSQPEEPGVRGARPALPSERGMPSKIEMPSGSSGQNQDAVNGLVRRAEALLESGKIDAARELLQQAAEQGSGPAALKLARSYDPARSGAVNYADSQTNAALAQAWYERALALGNQEAAAYISEPGVR